MHQKIEAAAGRFHFFMQRGVAAVGRHGLQRGLELVLQRGAVLADGDADAGVGVERVAGEFVGVGGLAHHGGGGRGRVEGGIDPALGEGEGDDVAAGEREQVDGGLAGVGAFGAERLGRGLEGGADGDGDLAAAQVVAAGDVLGVALLDDDLVADANVGDHVGDSGALGGDVQAADAGVDAAAEKGGDHALELHPHHVRIAGPMRLASAAMRSTSKPAGLPSFMNSNGVKVGELPQVSLPGSTS